MRVALNDSIMLMLSSRVPEDSEEFGSVAEAWIVDAFASLSTQELDPLSCGLDLKGRAGVLRQAGVRYGEPGELWVTISKYVEFESRMKVQPWTKKTWADLLNDLREVPAFVEIRASILDGQGFPGNRWMTVSLRREVEVPEWITMTVRRDSRVFADPVSGAAAQELWLDFLGRRLDAGTTPLFGSLSDDGDGVTFRTELEDQSGLFHDETLPVMDRLLRGYSWVTVCSPDVGRQLGGPNDPRVQEAFFRAEEVAGGALLLRATQDIRDYGPGDIAAVHGALVDVLPSAPRGGPVPGRASRIVFGTRT